ncbi:MAG: ABC transporter ATP-binding protein [Flavobacteriales bacterium]
MAEKNKKSPFNWSIFSRLYSRGKPYRVQFYFTLLLVLLLASVVWIRPEQMRLVLDDAMPAGDYQKVMWLFIWFVVMLTFESVIQYFQTRLANRIAQSVTLEMRADLYKHVLRFRLSYFDKTPVGQFVTRLVSDVDGVAEVFSVGVLDIVRDLLKLIVIIGFMFYMDWKMTLIVLLPIPVLLYATRLFQLAVRKSFNDVRNEVARINVFIQEHVTGMSIVQIFNREKREKEKFEQINREHRDAHIRGIWAYSIFFPVVELLSAASVSLMLWWGLHESLSGYMTPGVLLEFSTFIAMMYRPIRQMADNFNVLQMGVVNAERVFKLFDTNEAQPDIGTFQLNDAKGEIEFRKVSFAYIDEQYVLHDISLKISSGEMIAFVGATGAGKSSIAGLLNRAYDFQQGEILLDGRPIRSYTLQSLRENIAMVQQDVFLFSDSIMNNITLYNQNITIQEVVEASKLIGTHHFIMQLPGGYHYNVRERGGMLSVGQRQLIAFVRAYVQHPKILVLDEATSSVDTESELLIQQATEKLTQGRTSLVIAHRLSTIRQADKIVVIDNGRIAEQGTHDELLAHHGLYKKLFELQFQM